jgi:hypothetical protein
MSGRDGCYECGFEFDHQRLTACPNCGTVPDSMGKMRAENERLRRELRAARRGPKRRAA